MVTTMDRWAKHLQVVFGGLTLGALLALASGHLLNSTQPFPRPVAGILLVLSIGCGLVSRTLADRKLTVADRLALLGLVVALLGSFFQGSPTAGVIGLALGLACLLFTRAWGVRISR